MRNSRSGPRKKLRAELRELKDVPCHRCGIRYPYYVMDFYHARGRKRFSISQMAHSPTENPEELRETIMRELEKCVVMCANCSREEAHRPSGRKETLAVLNAKIARAATKKR